MPLRLQAEFAGVKYASLRTRPEQIPQCLRCDFDLPALNDLRRHFLIAEAPLVNKSSRLLAVIIVIVVLGACYS